MTRIQHLDNNIQEQERGDEVSSADLGNLCILLIEDNPDIQVLFHEYLHSETISIFQAQDAPTGIGIALKELPDIVLMDLQLPEMSGFDALTKLRSLGYQNPILAISAHAMSGQKERCLDFGFSDFLPKPVTKSELRKKIIECLKRTV